MPKLATYEGIVEDGHVTLLPNLHSRKNAGLHIGARCRNAETFYVGSPRLVHPGQAKDFEMQVIEDTTDADV